MRSLCRKAGVRHFRFHAIRHFAASYLADKAKESMPTISRLLIPIRNQLVAQASRLCRRRRGACVLQKIAF
jgi:integrase